MKRTVIIAGGGTGGHIYPGVAIARALQALDPQIDIQFVGTHRGLESQILAKENLPLHLIESGQLNVSSLSKKLKTLWSLPVGLWQSLKLLLELKPVFVLGVGGYASGPFVLISSLMGFNSAVWEPNAMPGLANRWLSRFVDRCFVVFEEAKVYLKNNRIDRYGMPVRDNVEKVIQKKSIEGRKCHVLLFGGSQGARTLNDVLMKLLQTKPETLQNFEFIHQTGKSDFAKVQKFYQDHQISVTVLEYIYDMPAKYEWADMTICRGGASSLAEVAQYQVVPIIVPLKAADNHQEKNAQSFVKSEAGALILNQDLTEETLFKELEYLRTQPERLYTRRENLKKLFEPGAALQIAKEIADEIATS